MYQEFDRTDVMNVLLLYPFYVAHENYKLENAFQDYFSKQLNIDLIAAYNPTKIDLLKNNKQ